MFFGNLNRPDASTGGDGGSAPLIYGQPIPLITAPENTGIFAKDGYNWLYHPFTGESGVSIGNAFSGANYADARLINLYHALSGAGVWASNETRTLPNYAGRAMVAAGQGAGLTARSPGSQFGAESQYLTAANVPPLSASFSGSGYIINSWGHYAWEGVAGIGGLATGRSWGSSYYAVGTVYVSGSGTANAGGGTQPLGLNQASQSFPVVFLLGAA